MQSHHPKERLAMTLARRSLLGLAASGIAAGELGGARRASAAGLTPMTAGVAPIGTAERLERIARAQGLMRAHDMSAVFIEAGPSLSYFTGVRWGRSERLTGVVLPVDGEPLLVTTGFEEASVRESLAIPAVVRVWQEDENPLALVGDWLRERGLQAGPIGIEETVRYTMSERLAAAVPGATLTSANPVVRQCRMLKSDDEIDLMRRATEITMAAYTHVIPAIQRDMRQSDIAAAMLGAMAALGGEDGWALVLVGEASAYPHGAKNPKAVAKDDLILMDCGCGFQGYQADVSRTFVFGTPTAAHRRVWDEVHRGQQTAFAAARIGAPCGSVDDAVRAYYESLGYGPRYRLPGLSHRTGHGIGLETHEWAYLVRGEATPLQAGMCFSDEPGLYAPGAFGVRLEDCFHMTPNGPRWFSQPSVSIEKPI
jgi:Xaa-Pro dipeptidase